jgi:hypothetical protein
VRAIASTASAVHALAAPTTIRRDRVDSAPLHEQRPYGDREIPSVERPEQDRRERRIHHRDPAVREERHQDRARAERHEVHVRRRVAERAPEPERHLERDPQYRLGDDDHAEQDRHEHRVQVLDALEVPLVVRGVAIEEERQERRQDQDTGESPDARARRGLRLHEIEAVPDLGGDLLAAGDEHRALGDAHLDREDRALGLVAALRRGGHVFGEVGVQKRREHVPELRARGRRDRLERGHLPPDLVARRLEIGDGGQLMERLLAL